MLEPKSYGLIVGTHNPSIVWKPERIKWRRAQAYRAPINHLNGAKLWGNFASEHSREASPRGEEAGTEIGLYYNLAVKRGAAGSALISSSADLSSLEVIGVRTCLVSRAILR